MRVSRRLVLRVVALALALGPAGAAAADEATTASREASAESAQRPERKAWKSVRFHHQYDLDVSYTSNFYHLPESEHDALQEKTEPYQRYHGMEGPSDTLTTASVGLEWSWKHRSKRRVVLSLDSSATFLSRNPIADTVEFELAVAGDLTKKDRLKLELEYSPEHFRKNYANEPFIGFRVYSRADHSDRAARLRYSREISSDWKAALEISRSERRFDDPFSGRDRELIAWYAEARYRVSKRVALVFGVGAGQATTPESLEFGVVKDRSFDQRKAVLGIDLKLPRKWRVELDAGYRTRSYTTAVVEDLSRFGRKDQRWSFGLDVRKRLAKKWYLTFHSDWKRNRTDTLEADPSGDETGYRDYGLGVGLSVRL